MLMSLIRAARPVQWSKNGLVFAGPLAAGVLDERGALLDSSLAFAAFCAAASAAYLMNDIVDRESDRLHPRKRDRPIASGLLSPAQAGAAAAVLLVVAAGGAAAIGERDFGLVLGAYVVTTGAYNVYLKHVLIADLMVVAGGFVFRAMAGTAAVGVGASVWFLATTSFASLFVVTGKRFAELLELGVDAGDHRATLDEYPLPFLRTVLGASLAATVVTYCLWAFDTGETNDLDIPLFELSIVPVVAALLRYQLLLELGKGGAPEEVMTGDRAMQLLSLCWALLFIGGVYVA
jgi:decaprenyl-phosphate phosphoribosyltransferase